MPTTIRRLGLAPGCRIVDGFVIRQPKAYPVYAPGYRTHVEALRETLRRFDNLHMVGRNGQHRYDNQDHAMETALLAAANVLGGNHDSWAVNTGGDHLEAHAPAPGAKGPSL